MLRSFTIAGFRNFGPERRFVGPLGRVNIFIGTNNSGKSNVLRYVKTVVVPALSRRNDRAIELTGIDRPAQGKSVDSIQVGVAFERVEKHANWQPIWFELLKEAGVLDADEQTIFFDVKLGAANQQNIYCGEILPLSAAMARQISNFEMNVVGVSHGDLKVAFNNLMGRLYTQYQASPLVHYIPSFRQINTRLSEFEGEYSKDVGENHLIDDLAELSAPSYDQQFKKDDFEKLRKFVGEVIDDNDVRIEIPANRRTINVRSGANFLPVEALGSGIHEVVMLAAEIILKKNSVILLEEPEVHLHPVLQRRLMRFIMDETDSQFFITTHSSTIIDTSGAQIFGVSQEGSANVQRLLTSHEKFSACHELGYRSSDLLQANCVIWVEGPSDRIYVNYGIKLLRPDLFEGIDYAFALYGGKVLSHFSAEDTQLDDLISVLSICRFAAFIMDSDLGKITDSLRENKKRVINELQDVGGLSWVTDGREIENYFSFSDRKEAISAVHSGVEALAGSATRFGKPLEYRVKKDGKVRTADKIKVARYLVEKGKNPIGDWNQQIKSLIDYIDFSSKSMSSKRCAQ